MSSDLSLSDVDLIYLRSDKVSRLAILTLIYRAIPAPTESGSSGTFIPECIETARAALEHHQACVASLKETSEILRCSYMHWSVPPAYSPFPNLTTANQGNLPLSLRPLHRHLLPRHLNLQPQRLNQTRRLRRLPPAPLPLLPVNRPTPQSLLSPRHRRPSLRRNKDS